MKHAVRDARALIAAAICAGLLAVAPAAQASASDEMSEARAGRYYLQTICRANKAQDTFAARVWHGRERIEQAEVRRRLPELRRYSDTYSQALYRAARELYDPPQNWPSIVVDEVNDMRRFYLRDSDLRGQMGYAANAVEWLRLNARSNTLSKKQVRASRKIRAILNLPPPGSGC